MVYRTLIEIGPLSQYKNSGPAIRTDCRKFYGSVGVCQCRSFDKYVGIVSNPLISQAESKKKSGEAEYKGEEEAIA